MKKLFFIIFLFFISLYVINAECNDDDLNEWATTVDAVFTENISDDDSISQYAYFLSINSKRDDIYLEVVDQYGNKAKAKMFDSINIYGVGAYTNLEEAYYVLNIYGGENSKCKNELLKSITYTVPRYNRMIKDTRCEGREDLEICKTFTNSTKNMSENDFTKEISKYIEPEKDNSLLSTLVTIFSYLLFIIAPFLIVFFVYLISVRKVKKAKRDR